jgi:glycosyltransferase involved in cell wall biosynthesis
MKILIVMKKHLDLATNKSARIEILRSLQRQGHDARLLTGFRHTRDDYGLPPGTIRYVASLKTPALHHLTFMAGTGAHLARLMAGWRPDVVLMDPNTCLAAWPWHLARRLGLLRTAFVLDVRTTPVDCRGVMGRLEERLFGAALRYAARWMDGITVITPFMREALAAEHGLDAGRIGVWSSGVSLSHFDPARYPTEETRDLRRELGLDGRFVFLCHGSLEPSRGVGTTIRALAALGDRGKEIGLLIVGRGPALPALRRDAARLGLEERVVFREAVSYDEIPRYVAAADAGMVPWPDLIWWRTGSPLKLMEFLAMGKPSLVTDIEAHRDLLGEATFAFYGGRGEVADWADGLLHVRSALVGQRDALATAARQFAIDNLTWDRQADRLCAYIDGIRGSRLADAGSARQAAERIVGEHPRPERSNA